MVSIKKGTNILGNKNIWEKNTKLGLELKF